MTTDVRMGEVATVPGVVQTIELGGVLCGTHCTSMKQADIVDSGAVGTITTSVAVVQTWT